MTAGAKTATGAAAVTMGVTELGLGVVALKATAVSLTVGAALLVGGNAVTSHLEQRTAAPVSTTTSASARARISARTEAMATSSPAKASDELPSIQLPPHPGIEALAQTGERSEATRLAAQFLSRYPSSLHERHVRELIDIQ